MALINCPECEYQVSEKARCCPNCGFPINKLNEKSIILEEKIEEKSKTKTETRGKMPIIIIIIVIIIVLVAALSGNANDCEAESCNNSKTTSGRYCSAHTCLESGCNSYKSKSNLYCSYHESVYLSYNSNYSYQSIEDILTFSNIKLEDGSSYTYCNGTITNNGNKTYYFVEVKGAFKDYLGNVIDTDWTYAVGSEGLSPGESTKFRISVDKSYQIDDVTLSIIDYST